MQHPDVSIIDPRVVGQFWILVHFFSFQECRFVVLLFLKQADGWRSQKNGIILSPSVNEVKIYSDTEVALS